MRSYLIIIGLIFTIQSYGQDYNNVIVFLNSKPDKEEITAEAEEELQKAHRENIGKLVDEGKLIVAGPFDGGGGIFVLTTDEVSIARAWLDSDPAIKANRWDIELYPIKYLHGGACLAKEPYEMVNYSFVRVDQINEIANYKSKQAGNDIWESLVDDKSILMVGVFPQRDGGIIVYTGKEITSWFGKNQDEQVSLAQKKLWVAKGSFCE
jgi:uncharacterized protein YciI